MSTLAACLVVRDEARDLPGWFAHHAAVGVQQFVVIDHGSTDGTGAVLERMGRLYDVRLLRGTFTGPRWQIDAYGAALRQARTTWCAFVDADEYLMGPGDFGRHLVGLPQAVSGVLLNWAVFGSSGHLVPPTGLVPDRYLRRAPLDADVNRFFKSVVRVDRAIHACNPHLFTVVGDQVDANGAPVSIDVDLGRTVGDIPVTPWRVNHYALRSLADYQRRVARGSASGSVYPADRWALWDRNDEEDLSAPYFHGARWRHEMARAEPCAVIRRTRELIG